MKLSGYRNILIFGSSQGIGKALALEYAPLCSNLILMSRNMDAVEKLRNNILIQQSNVFLKKCDVSIISEVKDAIEYALNKVKTIDLAVLNAGVGNPEQMEFFKSENYKKAFEINTFGIANALEFLIPVMKSQGYGTIAGVTSLADVRGYPGSSSYCSSKAAASILLESARLELKKFNINIITIRPGFVRTAMTDKNEFWMPFLMESKKAAKIIIKGIEKKKSVVQFPFFTVNLTRLVKNIPNFLYDPILRNARNRFKG